MKKILPILLLFAVFEISAQQTFDLDWEQGINGDAASLTIGTGDTVRWTWTNGAPHNVVSDSGSTESFASDIETGVGFQYSYTFLEVGVNPYRCTVHPSSMFGTITVDETLSVDDKFKLNLKSFPNPVEDEVTVTSLFKVSKIQVVSMLGKEVMTVNTENENIVNLKMSSLSTGLYFLKVTSETGQSSVLRVMKK